MKPEKFVIVGLMVTFATFFLALATLDYSVMHMQWDQPNWLYKYWISLGIVVTVFAFALSYMAWAIGMPKRYAYAIFFTVWLLFTAGLLDLFYFVLATLRGEAYSFQYWAAEWKWFVENGILPAWGWTQQIAWILGCLTIIALIWWKTLKK